MTINRALPPPKKKRENMVAVSRPDGCCFALLCAVRTLAYKSQSIPAQPVVPAYAQVSALQDVSSIRRKWIGTSLFGIRIEIINLLIII